MWKKVILLFFIVCLLSALLIGCGGVIPPNPDEPIEPIIPETTKVAEEETIQEIASVTEDQSIIIFKKSTPQLEELAVGDIIAMGVTKNTPEGLLRKVTKVTKGGKDSSEVVVETEFATLEEAIEQGEFYFNEALKAEDAKEPVCYVKGVEFIRDKSTIRDSKIQLLEFTYNINAIIYDGDNNSNTEEDNIALIGQISFDYNLLLSGKIAFPHKLKELNFQNIVEIEKSLGVTVGGSVELFSYEKVLWTHSLGTKLVWVGYLPIVLSPKITISANVNGEIFAKVTAEITDKDTYTAGIKFVNGSWQPISRHENYPSPPSLSLSAGGAVTFGVGPKLECKVDGVIGPYCETSLYGKVIADIYTNPWWKIYVGIIAKAGVKIEIFSKVLASANFTILDLKKIIAQADGPFNVNHPPVITSTPVTSATKGQPYSYNVIATDSDGDTLTYSLTTKPSGMSINSFTGLISWTPSVTGNYDVTVKVSDGTLFDSQSFTITVQSESVILSSITVSPPTMNIDEGDAQTIASITAHYNNGGSADVALNDCTYDSSNPGVATVNAGVITAVALGTATITVSYTEGGITKTDTVAVTVNAITPTPAMILSPVIGDLEIVSSIEQCSNTKWCFNQHKSGYHSPGGGICQADDTYAWDANLNTPSHDSDNGMPVYAVEEGIISQTYGGCINAGGSYGQLLIEHTYQDNPWWSGYLHLKDIQVTTGQSVDQNTLLGYISNTSPKTIPNHLHFVVYKGQNSPSELISFDTNIIPRDFPQTYYTITASAGPDGSISPSGSVTVNQGSDKSFTITPDTGYSINDVLVDGSSVGAVSLYTFTNITQNHTISATFNADVNHAPVISSLTANPFGIDINQTTTITCNAYDQDGDSLTYNWTKTDGTFEGSTSGSSVTWRAPSTEGNYKITCGVNDGEASDSEQVIISVGEVNHAPVITSTPVTSATIDEPYSYDVNATDSDGDTLTYSLTTKPSGMSINSFTGLISWTPSVTGNYDVTVKVSDGTLFDSQSFTITVQSESVILSSITVSPSTMSLVEGDTQTITSITAHYSDDGTADIALDDCTYDSNDIGVATVNTGVITAVTEGTTTITVSYTESGITETDTVAVTVTSVAPNTYTITASAGPNGSISPSGNITVNQGSDQSFTITPDTGYSINDVLVDGSSVGAVSSYTFSNVNENHIISATFISLALSPVHNLTKDTYYDTIQTALDDANSLGGDTIEVADGTYDESITFPSGKKVILRSVNGPFSTIIRGNNGWRTVTSDGSLAGTTLEGFAITYASGNEGRGIVNWGNLNIKNCIISGNYIRDGYGGGIHNGGSMTISGSTISGNSASPSGYGGWGGGGGIYNSGTLTITGSTISGNSATYESGGIFNVGSMTITESIISGNDCYYGGGIYNERDAILTITGSTISGNRASFNGGGIRNVGSMTISGSTVSSNYAGYNNGGIEGIGNLLTITGSTISDNEAGTNGGGIYLSSSVTIISIGGESPADKNTICGNYKIGESPSLDQQIRGTSGSLYETYKDTNYISAYCN